MIDVHTDMAVRLAKARAKCFGYPADPVEAYGEFIKAAEAIADDLITRNFHLMTEQIEKLR